jgi:leucyl aminopeptidase
MPRDVEAVVVLMTDAAEKGPELSEPERAALGRLRAAGVVKGKAKEIVVDVVQGENGKFRRLIAAGIGSAGKVSAESVRQAAGLAIKTLRSNRLTRAAIVLPERQALDPAKAAEAAVIGALLAAFDYTEYKGTGQKSEDKDNSKPSRLDLSIVAPEDAAGDVRSAVERARIIADGQNFARTIASRPGNNINPPALAKVAQDMAREVGLRCRVLDEREMQKLGMGGILAVGSGSIATPPRMIVLEYPGTGGDVKRKQSGGMARASKQKQSAAGARPVMVVGKAITFDTGGISIKPADKMGRMIFDKCGAMAVLGLMYAIARLKPAVPVVGILSSAENAISSQAYRPGDILRMYNGVTVEVTNTDAEGRLVLADALAWGIETYQPAAVVDLATLTGGVVVALGKSMAGVMTNDEALVEELGQSADAVGEKVWRLPLNEDLRDYMRSDSADIVNSGGREGSPLQGAAFLSFFVPLDGSCPWCHLDIAGVADTEKELPYYAKGATGWGVRTLVEWVERRSGGRS